MAGLLVADFTTVTVKPSMIQGREFFSTPLDNWEMETVAHNIVVICTEDGDKWQAFSWDEYVRACKHAVTDAERLVLDKLASRGYLQKDGDKYAVTDSFVKALSKYVVSPRDEEV